MLVQPLLKEHTFYRICDHDLMSIEQLNVLTKFTNSDLLCWSLPLIWHHILVYDKTSEMYTNKTGACHTKCSSRVMVVTSAKYVSLKNY